MSVHSARGALHVSLCWVRLANQALCACPCLRAQALEFGAELLAPAFSTILEVSVVSHGPAKHRSADLLQALQKGFKVCGDKPALFLHTLLLLLQQRKVPMLLLLIPHHRPVPVTSSSLSRAWRA